MKKKGKFKTILRAFTEEKSELEEAVLEFRRTACFGCPQNSENASKEDMSIVDLVRKKTNSNAPHCILCGCFIDKKTSQANEECSLSTIGEEPKWTRVKVETVSKNSFDLLNNTPAVMSVDLSSDNTEFDIKFNPVKSDRTNYIFKGKFSLIYPKKGKIEFTSTSVSCGCTVPVPIELEDRLEVDFTVDIPRNNRVKNYNMIKYLYVNYTLDGEIKKLKLNLRGNIKWT